mmetsp:Transcript_14428/g.20452  ORF Transcript_14428/g.20452 Transcript_14428/m.20452 type:complete len:340 (-) Transcript_14428:2-1021(-)
MRVIGFFCVAAFIFEKADGFVPNHRLSTLKKSNQSSGPFSPSMVIMTQDSKTTGKINGFEGEKPIILSTVERARTVTHIANSGSLCTYSKSDDPVLQGAPFGSHVDYVLDSNGWPIFLLAEASLHTNNIKANSKVSLLCQTPAAGTSQPAAAMSRVTLVGNIEEVNDDDELIQLKATFSLVHSYADQISQSPRFKFYKLRPEHIYYVGGYGVLSKWINVEEYENAKPDILADEAIKIVTSINRTKQEDLSLVCKQFAMIKQVDKVVVTTVDRLGLDFRVTSGQLTDEFRVGFRQTVSSVEDAKSEIVKIFQEAWEKQEGYVWEDQDPPLQRYAEDILRS